MQRRWAWSIWLVSLWVVLGGAPRVASGAPDVAQDLDQTSEDDRIDRAKALYIEGHEAFQAGDPATALSRWEEAYHGYVPHLHVFNFNIGMAAFELGDCIKARDAFHRFLELMPDHPQRSQAQDRLIEIERSGCATGARWGDGIARVGESLLPLHDEVLEVRIDHQHAHGVLQRRFDNPSSSTLEGLFEFDGGPGAHVVGFAYWNQAEKIVGQVFERNVATAIYERTVRRERDPGLLVSAGDGRFRFTVFPIFPNERKKVEVQFERWLTRRGDQVELRVPLYSTKAWIDVTIQDERRLAAFESPTHQIAVEREPDGDFRVRSGRARPEADALVLRWTVIEDEPLRAYVHRDPGQDAYLVLTMAPPVTAGHESSLALTDLKLRAEGSSLHAIHPQPLPAVAPDEELVVVARVEGSGPLQLRLTGRGPEGPFTVERRVTIPEQAQRPWVARHWARHRVEHLLERINRRGPDQAKVDEVVELALAYEIVTPYTAFLAMPESELMGDTAWLMRDARQHKQRILEEHPDAAAIRGGAFQSDANAPQLSSREDAMEAEESPSTGRRGKGAAAGCASCRAGREPGAGLLWIVLMLVLRRSRGVLMSSALFLSVLAGRYRRLLNGMLLASPIVLLPIFIVGHAAMGYAKGTAVYYSRGSPTVLGPHLELGIPRRSTGCIVTPQSELWQVVNNTTLELLVEYLGSLPRTEE